VFTRAELTAELRAAGLSLRAYRVFMSAISNTSYAYAIGSPL
jgi:hypothetical protein